MTAILFLFAIGGSGSLLTTDTSTVDRGEIKAGAPLTQSFKLTNRSTHRLDVTGVTVSCGCSKFSWDVQRIEPGTAATLTVDVNTLAQAAGSWTWTATVKYRSPAGEETLPLRMTGTLVREVTLTPPGLAFSLERGGASQTLTLTDARDRPLTIRALSVTSTLLSAELQKATKPGETRIVVTVADKVSAGEHSEGVVATTDDPAYPELRIPVRISVQVARKVKAHPEELVVQSDDESIQRIVLRRTDAQPVRIAKCECDKSEIGLRWSSESGPTALLFVTLPKSIRDTPGRTDVTVALAEPAGEVVRVPVAWR